MVEKPCLLSGSAIRGARPTITADMNEALSKPIRIPGSRKTATIPAFGCEWLNKGKDEVFQPYRFFQTNTIPKTDRVDKCPLGLQKRIGKINLLPGIDAFPAPPISKRRYQTNLVHRSGRTRSVPLSTRRTQLPACVASLSDAAPTLALNYPDGRVVSRNPLAPAARSRRRRSVVPAGWQSSARRRAAPPSV